MKWKEGWLGLDTFKSKFYFLSQDHYPTEFLKDFLFNFSNNQDFIFLNYIADSLIAFFFCSH